MRRARRSGRPPRCTAASRAACGICLTSMRNPEHGSCAVTRNGTLCHKRSWLSSPKRTLTAEGCPVWTNIWNSNHILAEKSEQISLECCGLGWSGIRKLKAFSTMQERISPESSFALSPLQVGGRQTGNPWIGGRDLAASSIRCCGPGNSPMSWGGGECGSGGALDGVGN